MALVLRVNFAGGSLARAAGGDGSRERVSSTGHLGLMGARSLPTVISLQPPSLPAKTSRHLVQNAGVIPSLHGHSQDVMRAHQAALSLSWPCVGVG